MSKVRIRGLFQEEQQQSLKPLWWRRDGGLVTADVKEAGLWEKEEAETALKLVPEGHTLIVDVVPDGFTMVENSALLAVRYAECAQDDPCPPQTGHLDVVFPTGDRWCYQGVPRETYEAMMAAPSVGSFFAQKIKRAFASYKVQP